MKFLVFNLTVAAALVYLLTTDRAEVQKTAGRIHDAATEMKQAASRVVDRGRSLVGGTPEETPVHAPSPAELSVRPDTGSVPMAPETAPRNPLPRRITAAEPLLPGKGVPGDGPRKPAAAPLSDTAAPRPVAASPSAAAEPAMSAKEAAALQRREEILQGIDPAVLIPTTKTEAETAQQTLSPEERRKRLYALSEEMELFYARTLGK